ncbi:MAG TPA: methylmalonyl Co-A mutase-associated GTPase MeaB [Thermoplasmata archaeon]|nr:methylmalonyl Co-A mutase-associated GTPase MeaB [Thermoplasmata archaeon]
MPSRTAPSPVRGLVRDLLAGDKRAAAKLISLIEDDEPEAAEALALVYPHTGHAQYVGFTGAPGVGKSSLINQLVREFRTRGKKVGVVAVDPTSPYSGGAVLGDRIRMADTGIDPGVFIRSMATRGHAGGLALATFDAVRVLDAMGMDLVLVETVGAGQSEVEIAGRAHTTVVVEMPLTGDAVQTMKAGILEIGDLYVVNKSDLADPESLVANLRFQIEERDGWRPPILRTSALKETGIDELADAIVQHRALLGSDGRWQKREAVRARQEILENARRLLANRVRAGPTSAGFERLVQEVVRRTLDPQAAAIRLLAAGTPHRSPRARAKTRR